MNMEDSINKKDPYADREAQKYERPIPSREFILEYLAERGKPATLKHLINELALQDPEQQEALRRRLIAMVRDGQLLRNRRDAYGPLGKMELIAGHVIGHKDGFGFVEPETGDTDLFLAPREMRAVFHGDRVLARVAGIDQRGRREATIVEVVEHNTKQLVGRYFEESGASFIEPVNKRITQEILIPPEGRSTAKHGQMVVVNIITQPSARERPTGEIVEILGDHMAPGMEIDVAIRNHELPHIWPEEVLTEAARFAKEVPEQAIQGRKDIRHLPLVTIDGEDAKDFDDAVYCELRGKQSYRLYVAIADVSYYVRPGTAIDREAYQRGNSVYFPAHVIPMLPEVLSNGLCSLNPNVNRLAVVCEMEINAKGTITSYDFYEATIKSQARLTYNKVHAMIEKNDKQVQADYPDLVPHLKNLYDLFAVLRQAREIRGAIDFNLPETKIVYDENRKIKEIVPYERFDSHRVIEECMLCANISASKFLLKHNQPTLFRIHEGPSDDKIKDLRKFLNELGLKMPGRGEPTPLNYSKLLQMVEGRPDSHLIQTVLLRSLSQAIYSPENKGHFGLAYEAYAHFTSPIRRYPDLLVHRGIKNALSKIHLSEDSIPQLEKHGEHCSTTERRADEATREAIDWLKCEFMMDKVGEEFSGVISSVTSFGFFVELSKVYAEGLVHISTLPNDYYKFDPIKHLLYGGRSGRTFRLGDVVEVQVARVDLDECKIDFVLAGEENKPRDRKQEKKAKRKEKEKKKKKKKKMKKSRRR